MAPTLLYRRREMGRVAALLLGAGLGAVLAYELDPQSGRRRRALARDHGVKLWRVSRDGADTAFRDLRHRTRGIGATVRRRRSDHPEDRVLAARIRAVLGTATRHPRAIHVQAAGGRVTLRGPVLADEVERVRAAVRDVRDVEEVEDRLEVHEEAGRVPALQGGPAEPPSGPRLDIFQRRWAPATRLLAGLSGAALGAWGGRHGGAGGAAAFATGLALVVRAFANRGLRELLAEAAEPVAGA